MKNNIACMALVLAAVFFGSCRAHRFLYAPSATNAPMFNKKGETNLAAMYSAGGLLKNSNKGYNRGYDLQAGIAVSNHVALTANLAGRFEKDIYDSSNTIHDHTTLKYTRHSTEFGIGYFTPLDRNGAAFFDLYGGYGFGRYNMKEGVTAAGSFSRFHNVSINKFYLQPGFHFNGGKLLQVGLYTRITTTNYHDVSTSYTASEESLYNLDDIRHDAYVYLEPSLVIRCWPRYSPWLRFDMQFSTSMLMSQPSLYHRASYLALGVSFDFSKITADGPARGKTNNR